MISYNNRTNWGCADIIMGLIGVVLMTKKRLNPMLQVATGMAKQEAVSWGWL